MELFDENKDYYTKSDSFKRKNYREYLLTLDQDALTKELSEKIVGSKLKIGNWEMIQLADHLVDIKYGKEDD